MFVWGGKDVKLKKWMIGFLSVLMIISTSCYTVHAEERRAYINDDYVNVRTGPGTNYSIVTFEYQNLTKSTPTKVNIQVQRGQAVTIIGESGNWYKIRVYFNGYAFEGYTMKTYITPFNLDSAFEAEMNREGFPESYKPFLRALHACFGNTWTFKAYHTNIDWNKAVEMESTLRVNLIDGSNETYRSTDPGAFDAINHTWTQFQAGWYGVNQETVAFYLDPRNYLADGTLFAFESLSGNTSVTFESLKRVFKGYHWGQGSTEEERNRSMDRIIQEFLDAGQSENISPYLLAARAKQELGTSNHNASITGGEFEYDKNTYSGFYNFYNIGAYNTNIDGLIYAMGGIDQSATSYGRPWNTTAKAIAGGASFIGSAYIAQGQDTLYLQKFNVTPTNTFSHQYMQNVRAAYSEGWSSYKTYRDNSLLKEYYEFSIPVYRNMPEKLTTLPVKVNIPNPVTFDYVNSLDWTLKDVYVSGIDEKTPARDIIQEIKKINPLAEITIIDRLGNSFTNSYVGTGDTITIKDDTGQVSYRIVIYGDVTGDGEVDILDLQAVKKDLLDIEKLTGVYARAGYLVDEEVDILTLMKLKKHLLGIEKIEQK